MQVQAHFQLTIRYKKKGDQKENIQQSRKRTNSTRKLSIGIKNAKASTTTKFFRKHPQVQERICFFLRYSITKFVITNFNQLSLEN